MSDAGLIYPDGSFKSREEISASLAEQPTVEFTTPLHRPPEDFEDYYLDALDRQKARQEILGIPEHVEIDIDTDKPIILGLIGDVHAGGDSVDYELFHDDLCFLRDHPQAYALTVGDLTDSFFFTPAVHEHLLNIEEQYYFMQAALKELEGKLLVGISGNHDEIWASRMGPTMYTDFVNKFNAHYMEGVGYISLKVGDQVYRISAAHRHNGFSIYNHTHSAMRLKRDEAEGGDIYVTAHQHKKGNITQTQNMFGGEVLEQKFVSLGSYKETSGYVRGKGIPSNTRDQMGGTFLVLFPDRRQIEIYHTREEAADRVLPYLQ